MSNPNNCYTSENAPFFGVIGSPPGIPCSGHGSCVPAPAGTAWAALGRGLCVCDAGWFGGPDMFDMRVAYDALTGNAFSLDCSYAFDSHYVLWSLFLAAYIVKEVILIVAFKRQFDKVGFPSGGIRGFFGYTPYVYLLCDILGGNLLMCILGILKLANPKDRVLGTDAAATLCLGLGLAISSSCFSLFLSSQFRALANARTMNATTAGKLALRYSLLCGLATLMYVGLNVAPTLAALAAEKSLGPIANGESVILVIRNVGNVFWMMTYLFANIFTIREARQLVSSLIASSNEGPTAGTGKGESALRVVEFLQVASKKLRVQLIIITLVYIPFCIPLLWPYQHFPLTLMLVLGSHGSNQGLVLLQAKQAAKSMPQSPTTKPLSSSATRETMGSFRSPKLPESAAPTSTMVPKPL